jgi:hypothetical protein
MSEIKRQFPGKTADEIYQKVHTVMDEIARKIDMNYTSDSKARTGKVSKMGISGAYVVRDGEVTVDLKYPMLLPGAMKKRIQDDIEQRLSGLFA